jgi:hypothetical protein
MRISYSVESCGTYEVYVVGDESKSILVQTDWDRPGLARSFGWNGKVGRERCQHRGTDGTVKCPDCGRTPSRFIEAATDWLDSHEGAVVSDPGYFGE